MPITKDDLQDFQRFAGEKLERGLAESLVTLAGEWEAQRQVVNQGESEVRPIEMGLSSDEWRKLVAAFPDVEDKAKFQQALGRRGGVSTAQMLANAASAADSVAKK
jgi:hypothetical protein